jgi:nickel/cobalt transporter (NicO) family protein
VDATYDAPVKPSRTRRRRRRIAVAAIAAGLAALVLAGAASAHPLGNFTINHYAGIRVSLASIHLDVVLDLAEIPTFQERLRFDTDDDGEVSDAEAAAGRETECGALVPDLDLRVAGERAELDLVAAGLSFPSGAGGLSTMRLVCQLVAPLGSLPPGTPIAFADRSFAERLGWREIVVRGDGVTVEATGGATLPAADASARLTAYPDDRLADPLQQQEIAFVASPGGASLAAWTAPDATPIGGASVAGPGQPAADPPAAIIPGGVGAEIPAIFGAADLSPLALLLALGTAMALGALHALTPGHGKTLMAAYLVGTRGTAVHAAGLGLSVTVSHTLGILVLAALVVGAQGVLPADVVVRWTPAIAAVTIVAIGAWMLATELRRRGRGRPHAPHDHAHGHDHGHAHGDDAPHSHTHVAPPGAAITWRSLFALGLAGGIIPSTTALLILLGTIAAGRPAFGVVLVVAFGLGMAIVLGGVGLLLVAARGWLETLPRTRGIGRLARWTPLVAAVVVLGLGVWLTVQAFVGRPTL